MSVAGVNDATKRWKEWCDNVQAQTTVNRAESEADKQARIKRARADYAFFVNYYFPHYTDDPATGKHTESAPFHIEAANKIRKNRNLKAAFKWARGHAKSTHMDIMIPMWLKCQKVRDINVMVLVGKSQENANTLLADLQAELQYNQRYINDFGVQYNSGSWEEGEFVTADGCAFFARGRGQSPRGLRYRNHRPDYIVIDDLDDDELCGNKLTDWVKEALFGALDGGRGRFIMVGNLISKCSVLANICATDGVLVSQVNAIDKQGRVAWASKWSIDELRDMERFMGYRSFQKEMMNNPITEGAVFKHTWIKWKKLPKLCKYDYLVAYCVQRHQQKRLQGNQAVGKDRDGTAPNRGVRAAMLGRRNGALVVRPARADDRRRGDMLLLHRGEFPARHHPRRIYPRGEFTRVPATHTGGQTQEAGQVPAHRGNLPAVGARVRVLQRRQAERPRHARGTGTDPRV